MSVCRWPGRACPSRSCEPNRRGEADRSRSPSPPISRFPLHRAPWIRRLAPGRAAGHCRRARARMLLPVLPDALWPRAGASAGGCLTPGGFEARSRSRTRISHAQPVAPHGPIDQPPLTGCRRPCGSIGLRPVKVGARITIATSGAGHRHARGLCLLRSARVPRATGATRSSARTSAASPWPCTLASRPWGLDTALDCPESLLKGFYRASAPWRVSLLPVEVHWARRPYCCAWRRAGSIACARCRTCPAAAGSRRRRSGSLYVVPVRRAARRARPVLPCGRLAQGRALDRLPRPTLFARDRVPCRGAAMVVT